MPNPEFSRFVEKRASLNSQLDEARARVDAWLDEHESGEASATELAYLEGILGARRDLLKQLLDLDDAFMGHLLAILGRSRPD